MNIINIMQSLVVYNKLSIVYLGVNVHGDNVVQIDQNGATRFTESEQTVQLEEIGRSHKLQYVILVDI